MLSENLIKKFSDKEKVKNLLIQQSIQNKQFLENLWHISININKSNSFKALNLQKQFRDISIHKPKIMSQAQSAEYFKYPLKDICKDEWNRKVNATAMYSIPAEDEALPILYELKEVLQKLMQGDIGKVISEELVEYFFLSVFPPVCQKIIRSRYFKSNIVLKTSNQVLQYCVYLFPKYLWIAEKYPKFVEILTTVFCTDEYYFKTNNQLDHKLYPYQYFQHIGNNVTEPLKEGDLIDILKFSSSHDKMTWSQGKIIRLIDEQIDVAYLYDLHDKVTTVNVNSPQIAQYRSKSKDFEWRMMLKIGDLVDCQDSFGSWYNATVLEVVDKEQGKKLAKITLKVYNQHGNKVDEVGRFTGFSDYVENIDITSPKVQPYCSVCKERQYQSSKSSIDSIDDINDSEFEEVNGKRIYALPRKRYLSDFMFKTLNGFGQLGGFQLPLNLFQQKIHFQLLCYYVKGISGVSPYLHKKLVKQLVQRLKPIIEKHIFDESEAVSKHFTKQKSEMLFSGLKALQKRVLNMQDVYQYQNSQKMKLVDKCLQSQALKRKLQGLNQLKDIIKTITHSSDRNKMIKNWMKEKKIFQKIYIVNSHVQLIKKSQDFFRYLINQSILEVIQLERLYRMAQKGDYQSRISLYKLFQEVSHIFKKPHVDFLIDTILESDNSLILNEDIDLLHELSKYSNYFPMEKVMQFFQKIVLGNQTPKELNDYAIKKYSDIVARSYQMKPYRRQIIKNLLQKLATPDVVKVCQILKGIFTGIGIGQWGKKDLNDILAEQNVDVVCLSAVKHHKKENNEVKLVNQILEFLLFIFKLSYRVKIHVVTLKMFWQEFKSTPDQRSQYFKWANQAIKCDQGIQDEQQKEEFENFFTQLFNEQTIADMNASQFELAKNFFVQINKKSKLLVVSNIIRERDREMQKQYKRKVEIKKLKLHYFLTAIIYDVKDFKIAEQGIQFFLNIYTSKQNSGEQVNQFLQKLVKDLARYNQAKEFKNVMKTLKLIEIVIDDSEKNCDAKIQSLLSKKKAESIKYLIINEVNYVNESAKKLDLTIQQNQTLLELRKTLAKQFNVSWQQIRIVAKNQISDFHNSRTLKELRIPTVDPLTISRRMVSSHADGQFFLDSQKKQMNPKATRVFKVIFERFSTDGKMSKDECNSFTAACLGTAPSTKYYSDKITNVYAKYDDDKDGLLSFENFFEFYSQSARERPGTVWSNLKSFGVRGDFKFNSQPTDEIDQHSLPRNVLSRNPQFYKILFGLLETKQLASIAFNLLQRLPVSKQVQEQVLGINDTDLNVNKILSMHDPFLLFYKLNIIQYLVDSSSENQSQNEADWVYKFIASQGFEHLLTILQKILKNPKTMGDIERQIVNTTLALLYDYLLTCLGSNQFVKDSISLMISQIDLDDKMEFLVTGVFPKSEQKLQKVQIEQENNWQGPEWQQVIKPFISLMKLVWAQDQNQYLRDSIIEKTLSILNILLIDKQPSAFTSELTDFLSKIPSLKIMRKLYCLVLCECFYSTTEYQSYYIRQLFKCLTASNITSEHFRVLAILVSKYGTAEVGGDQMQQILINNILNQNNQLTVEGCARLLCNFDLKDVTLQKFEAIWQKCLFGNSLTACKKQQTRTQLYQLIVKMCQSNPVIVQGILGTVIDTLAKSYSKVKINICSEINQRSANGYAGLKNLGNICYIISFMQQLYMNQRFRYLLLRIDDKEAPNMIVTKDRQILREFDDNFLHQVQNIFGFLEETSRVDFVPFGFCKAYKPYGQEVNIMMQQDVQQFIAMFFDNLENGIRKTPLKRLVENFYGGKSTNLFNCHQCKQTRRVQENFYCISLEVKNSKTLQDSLNRYILGQLISEFQCNFCNKKADVQKMTRISKPPKVLIIHLQRIVFNLDIFINEKITTKHSFPHQINMYPYSIQKYQERNRDKGSENKQVNQKDSQKQKENSGTDKFFEAQPEKPKQAQKTKESEYDYNLMGIICHIGNADAGHYISYIKTSEGKWLEFNDSIVSVFNPKNIQSQCFGGTNSAYDDEFDWDKKQNSKSAYILVYQKIGANTIEVVLEDAEKKGQVLKELSLQEMQQIVKDMNKAVSADVKEQQQTESMEESSSMVEDSEHQRQKQIEQRRRLEEQEIQMIRKQKSDDRIEVNVEAIVPRKPQKKEDIVVKIKEQIGKYVPEKIHNEIMMDNQIHFFQRNIASQAFPKFFSQLLTKEHSKYETILPLLKKMTFSFWLKSPNFKMLLSALGHFIKHYPEGIKQIIFGHEQIVNLMIQYSDQQVRTNIASFLAKCLEDVINTYGLKLNGETELDRKIQAFLQNLLSLLPTTVSKCWTKFSQYFQFWYDFSMTGQTAVRFMIRKEIIKHFLDYFLDKKSPLQIYANKAHQIGSKYANPNFSMLLRAVTRLIEKCLQFKQQKLLKKDDYTLLLHHDCLQKLISDSYETVAANLVRQICKQNIYASQKVAVILLKGICKSTFDNVQPYLDVVHQFILIQDKYQDVRMKWIIGKQTLAVSPTSRQIVAMNSYSMDQRIYNFDSTYQLEQTTPLMESILAFYKKVQTFAILCLKEALRLCNTSEKIRNYIFQWKSPTVNMSHFVDFFEEFINRYIEDAKRLYNYHSSGFNKEDFGNQVKKLYTQVLEKYNKGLKQNITVSSKKQKKKQKKKASVKKSLDQKQKTQQIISERDSEKKMENRSQQVIERVDQQETEMSLKNTKSAGNPVSKQSENEQVQLKQKARKIKGDTFKVGHQEYQINVEESRQQGKQSEDRGSQEVEGYSQKNDFEQVKFQQVQGDMEQRGNYNFQDAQQSSKDAASPARGNRKRQGLTLTCSQQQEQQAYPQIGLYSQSQYRQTKNQFSYSSEQEYQYPASPKHFQLTRFQETYIPIDFKYKQVSSQQKQGILICRHRSQVTYALTKPTGFSNQAFSGSMGGQKTIDRLKQHARQNTKVEIVEGWYITNGTRDIVRIKTNEGAQMVRANQSAFVWAEQIQNVWTSERTMSWPKWSLYDIDEDKVEEQEQKVKND